MNPPKPDSTQPYYSTWVTQQLVDRYGAGRVFGGGLKITTTLDVPVPGGGRAGDLRPAERRRPERRRSSPSRTRPARSRRWSAATTSTSGRSTWPRTATASRARRSSRSSSPRRSRRVTPPTRPSPRKKKIFHVPGSKNEKFVVNNYEDSYSGVTTLAHATQQSDNSVYAELGLKIGTQQGRAAGRAARHPDERVDQPGDDARRPEGGRHPARDGVRVLDDRQPRQARVRLVLVDDEVAGRDTTKVEDGDDVAAQRAQDRARAARGRRQQRHAGCCTRSSPSGTGTRANVPVWAAGKTGTTENYGDAWFVGFTDRYTVAVWVGYPDKLKYMKTEYHGQPVAGGTYPAEIWHDFMMSVLEDRREPRQGPRRGRGRGGRSAHDARRPRVARRRRPPRHRTAPVSPDQGGGASPAAGWRGARRAAARRRRRRRRRPGTPAPHATPAPGGGWDGDAGGELAAAAAAVGGGRLAD